MTVDHMTSVSNSEQVFYGLVYLTCVVVAGFMFHFVVSNIVTIVREWNSVNKTIETQRSFGLQFKDVCKDGNCGEIDDETYDVPPADDDRYERRTVQSMIRDKESTYTTEAISGRFKHVLKHQALNHKDKSLDAVPTVRSGRMLQADSVALSRPVIANRENDDYAYPEDKEVGDFWSYMFTPGTIETRRGGSRSEIRELVNRISGLERRAAESSAAACPTQAT